MAEVFSSKGIPVVPSLGKSPNHLKRVYLLTHAYYWMGLQVTMMYGVCTTVLIQSSLH